MRCPTRIIVISDLHLGGSPPAMMSFPGRLAEFIAGLPGSCAAGEALELVLAGDVIDFLAIELDGHTDPWSPDAGRALAKLRAAIFGRDACVYRALADHLEAGHGLTILVGNHDLELALPGVQSALCAELRCRPGAIYFVDDGRAWRFGDVLVEHGNRYDEANMNDWDALREIASCQSRGERYGQLRPSPGSRLVHEVVQEYKQSFEFLDTLQPQGIVVAYLMAVLEPGLFDRLPALVKARRGQRLAARNVSGLPPIRRRHRGPDDLDDPDLEQIASELLFEGAGPTTRGPLFDTIRETLRSGRDSLLHRIVNGRELPAHRLEQIQKVLRGVAEGDRSLERDGPIEQFGAAAADLRANTGARVVVMGHTHQARHVGPPDMAEYINTGTWADLVTIPETALAPGPDGLATLADWLTKLGKDSGVRTLSPNWAELRIDADGHLLSARLMPPEPLATVQP